MKTKLAMSLFVLATIFSFADTPPCLIKRPGDNLTKILRGTVLNDLSRGTSWRFGESAGGLLTTTREKYSEQNSSCARVVIKGQDNVFLVTSDGVLQRIRLQNSAVKGCSRRK